MTGKKKDLKPKLFRRDWEEDYVLKEKFHQVDITNTGAHMLIKETLPV